MSNLQRSAPFLLRAFLAFPLILCAGFSSFGFLASFELAAWPQRLPWQAGYALLGVACVSGTVALLRPRKSPPSRP